VVVAMDAYNIFQSFSYTDELINIDFATIFYYEYKML